MSTARSSPTAVVGAVDGPIAAASPGFAGRNASVMPLARPARAEPSSDLGVNGAATTPGYVAACAARASGPPGPTVSFEFFPPKSAAAQARLWGAVSALEPLSPSFVSVTCGAAGSARGRTQRTIEHILTETSLPPAAHLTCIGATRSEIDETARSYWALGVRRIVALRGDPPEGIGARYEPHPDGYAYAADLVAGLKRIADFEVSVGVYPERHPESPTWDAEIDNLKRKADAGADRGLTQFFFDVEAFLRFMDRVRAAGIGLPIAPGIMPVTNFAGLQRMAALCGASVPAWLARLFEGLDERAETRALVAATAASELCARLAAEGYRDFHFYTLNRPALTSAICQVIGVRPRMACAA